MKTTTTMWLTHYKIVCVYPCLESLPGGGGGARAPVPPPAESAPAYHKLCLHIAQFNSAVFTSTENRRTRSFSSIDVIMKINGKVRVSHCWIDCTEFDNAICLPDTFVFKTLAIETNLYGILVEFQDFISQKVVKNVIEPPSTRQTLQEDENHFPVVRMFLREFSLKQCAETSVHKTTHPAVTKMTIVNFLVNVLQHNFNKQF